jgi:hypothetical protein
MFLRHLETASNADVTSNAPYPGQRRSYWIRLSSRSAPTFGIKWRPPLVFRALGVVLVIAEARFIGVNYEQTARDRFTTISSGRAA